VKQWNINGHEIGSPIPGDFVAFSPDGTQFVSPIQETVAIKNTDSKMTVIELVKLVIAVSLPMEGLLP